MQLKKIINIPGFKFILFIILLLGCALLGKYTKLDLETYRSFLSQFPTIISGIIFVGLYVVLTFFFWFGAKDVLRIASAILFGPYISTIYVWIGEQLNACVLFNLSRHLGRDYVVKKFKLKSHQIDSAEKDSSFLGVLAVRVNPLIPIRFMDLSAGLTQISFRKYFWIILFGSPVRFFGLQYILAGIGESIFKDPKAIVAFLLDNPPIVYYSSFYFLFVCVITLLAIFNRWFRKRNKSLPSRAT